MATYSELFGLRTNTDLRNKIAVACTKKAQALVDQASPSADELAWANTVFSAPLAMADKIMAYVLAANSSATTSQIANATDAAIQTNVDAAAAKLIAGGITS